MNSLLVLEVGTLVCKKSNHIMMRDGDGDGYVRTLPPPSLPQKQNKTVGRLLERMQLEYLPD